LHRDQKSTSYARDLHRSCTERRSLMTFLTDVQPLKTGLVIFRRTDVKHRNWYCRIKLPNADRYKTVSLKTGDLHAARDKAFEQDAEVRVQLKHDIPVFNKLFSQ